jgi:hypothetical protein
MCERDTTRVGMRRVSHGIVEVIYSSGGCLLSLSLCRRGFQDLLKVRPSSVLMFGCISSSMASLMSQSMYLVLAKISLVPCSLITWSRLMLCSTTADMLVYASLTCLLCSSIRIWTDRPLCKI